MFVSFLSVDFCEKGACRFVPVDVCGGAVSPVRFHQEAFAVSFAVVFDADAVAAFDARAPRGALGECRGACLAYRVDGDLVAEEVRHGR